MLARKREIHGMKLVYGTYNPEFKIELHYNSIRANEWKYPISNEDDIIVKINDLNIENKDHFYSLISKLNKQTGISVVKFTIYNMLSAEYRDMNIRLDEPLNYANSVKYKWHTHIETRLSVLTPIQESLLMLFLYMIDIVEPLLAIYWDDAESIGMSDSFGQFFLIFMLTITTAGKISADGNVCQICNQILLEVLEFNIYILYSGYNTFYISIFAILASIQLLLGPFRRCFFARRNENASLTQGKLEFLGKIIIDKEKKYEIHRSLKILLVCNLFGNFYSFCDKEGLFHSMWFQLFQIIYIYLSSIMDDLIYFFKLDEDSSKWFLFLIIQASWILFSGLVAVVELAIIPLDPAMCIFTIICAILMFPFYYYFNALFQKLNFYVKDTSKFENARKMKPKCPKLHDMFCMSKFERVPEYINGNLNEISEFLNQVTKDIGKGYLEIERSKYSPIALDTYDNFEHWFLHKGYVPFDDDNTKIKVISFQNGYAKLHELEHAKFFPTLNISKRWIQIYDPSGIPCIQYRVCLPNEKKVKDTFLALESKFQFISYNLAACDICKKSIKEAKVSWFYHCRICKYDTCSKCLETKVGTSSNTSLNLNPLHIDTFTP